MHTVIVVGFGFVLLGACVLLGRIFGASPSTGMATMALMFLPIWFIGAAINMWLGVRRAGYSVAEEAPMFLLVFGVPAAAALVIRWLVR